ncbi:hypothetical protein CC78DRAFT_578703 [Lojkania enalia]|uniref:Uncharacterized protein n=1 Tax=Lojkania enalia TaxID=147567 RepID=A0A9P4KCI1_9PLEO|nr:hypothetical protein CC78DRAFT_578703 [Didymosphaeria enalia]
MYEYYFCCDEYAKPGYVLAGWEHFVCNECTIEVFQQSFKNTHEFPDSCCGAQASPRKMFEHLYNDDFIQKYPPHLQERYTPQAIHVYCATPECARFLPSSAFQDDFRYAVAYRISALDSCVYCENLGLPEHRCDTREDANVKPDWIPPYSPDCHIKKIS